MPINGTTLDLSGSARLRQWVSCHYRGLALTLRREHVKVVEAETESALTRPDRTISDTDPRESGVIEMLPPSRSFIASVGPLYGTAVSSMFASCLKRSIDS
jgi:hypothetical protein